MAWPYIFQENFELGTLGGFDSKNDTGSKLDFPHYSTLSRIPNAPVPYRGAYCMRVQCSDTNSHTLVEGDVDIADQGTAFFRWYMFVSSDFTATADDVFSIFELQQAGGATTEQTVGMRVTAATNLLEIGVGDGTAPSSYVTFPRNKWVNVELKAKVSTTGAGTMDLYLDENVVISLTGLTQAAAVGTCEFGTKLTLATTTGSIYFDQFVMDDARLYGFPIRYPEELYLTQTGHAFVGQGVIENITLLNGTSTDSVVQIFDTDQANSLHTGRVKLELKGVTANDNVDPAGVPVHVQRGCFIVLTGTTPRAMVKVGFAQGYFSQGRIRQHGNAWTPTPGGW